VKEKEGKCGSYFLTESPFSIFLYNINIDNNIYSWAGNNLRFFTNIFRFLGFLGF